MMDTYRRDGAARVVLAHAAAAARPGAPEIARAVNAAIAVAAEPYRAQVRVLDMGAIFTPGGRYRDAMASTGATRSCASPTASTSTTRARELAADAVLRAVKRDFGP